MYFLIFFYVLLSIFNGKVVWTSEHSDNWIQRTTQISLYQRNEWVNKTQTLKNRNQKCEIIIFLIPMKSRLNIKSVGLNGAWPLITTSFSIFDYICKRLSIIINIEMFIMSVYVVVASQHFSTFLSPLFPIICALRFSNRNRHRNHHFGSISTPSRLMYRDK